MSFVQKQIKHLRNFFGDQKSFTAQIETVAKRYHIPVFMVRFSILWSRLCHGFNTSEYMNFEVFKMNHREKKTFNSSARSIKIVKKTNPGTNGKRELLDNKFVFNKEFGKFIQREWIYAPESSEEVIRSFLERHEAVIIKPVGKSRGDGIQRVICDETKENMSAFVDKVKKCEMLIEECVQQHHDMSAVNESSVNTIRVNTIRDKEGTVRFIAANLRGGAQGSILDNLHAGGAQYPIDVETGIIIRGGVRYDGAKNILFHPGSNKKMIGMEIPNWDKLKEMITEAGTMTGDIRYVGWDVAITEEGCELIEGNSNQGCNGMQLDGIGKFDFIKAYI